MTVVETETRTKTVEEEQVERGAAWLDKHRPMWDEEIDMTQLDLTSCSQCVIGQLFGGDYFAAIARLSMSRGDQAARGFFVDDDDLDYEVDNPSWDLLTEAWRDEIARRRA